jgi:DNA-binding transcriptional ArsR family regulator
LSQSQYFSKKHQNIAMNTPSTTASTVPTELHPPIDKLISALAAPVRWQILGELSAGEPLMVKELGERLNCSPTLISKHMAVLRRAGLVQVGRAGVYLIPPQFVRSTAERHVDFGHCLLRLPGANPPPSAA